jgi:hypothetical protein
MLRSFAVPVRLPVKFHDIETPCYSDSDIGRTIPFPFSFKNGILDIDYIDSFEADMVTTTGIPPSTEPGVIIQLFGGERLVQTLGPHFVEYIRAWRSTDSGTPVSIYSNGTVQKIQYNFNTFTRDSVYEVTTEPPSGDNYTIGNSTNKFRSTWVFKAPLTITTVESGVTQYITFSSRFDED